MNLNLTLLGQMISFSIFVWFCMKYVWPPVLAALHERQAKIAQGLADAEQGAQKREEAERIRYGELLTRLQAYETKVFATGREWESKRRAGRDYVRPAAEAGN